MAKENQNCLEGIKCPTCGEQSEVVVYASMWISLTDDGTDPYADATKNLGGIDYDETSHAICPSCGYRAKLNAWCIK